MPNTQKLVVISNGRGVQSWTMICMSLLGDLPPFDVALHSDTRWELDATYAFKNKWDTWAADRGGRMVDVSIDKSVTDSALNARYIPVHTTLALKNGKTKNGKAFRVCTHRWKVIPMRRWITAELKRMNIKRKPGVVEQWMGISMDEIQRVKPSRVKYIVNRYPLIEKRMTRQDCENYLTAHGIEVPPKSACWFCPLRGRDAWRHMRDTYPDDFQKAVDLDRLIRHARAPYDLFLHYLHKPLLDAVGSASPSAESEPETQDECSGVCFT